MTEATNDEARLRATELQMRRALGLREASSPSKPELTPPVPAPNGSHRPPRRFVRDGEVQVSVVHRDEAPGVNQLDAARQTIRSLTAARELAERSLSEAQSTIRDLQTKLAHERMARDEAVQRAEADRQLTEQSLQSAQADLAAEHASRMQFEEQLAVVLEHRNALERRLRDVEESSHVDGSDDNPAKRVRVKAPGGGGQAATSAEDSAAGTQSVSVEQPKQPRRRGRPRKVEQSDSEFVEWWKPGWKDRLL